MHLKFAHVTNFKSIENGGVVPLNPAVTVLVGQNESGKTAFLKALHKAVPVGGSDEASFSVIEDYPRRRLTEYQPRHASKPDRVLSLTYELTPEDVAAVNEDLGFPLLTDLTFSVHHTYDNARTISLTVDEPAAVQHVIKPANLSSEVRAAVKKSPSLRSLIATLDDLDLNEEEEAFAESVRSRFGDVKTTWDSLLGLYVWTTHLSPNIPRFLYFDDYMVLPGKVNLNTLQQRVSSKAVLRPDEKTVLALLRLANIKLADVVKADSYENSKAQLEGISNAITDKIFHFWTQNKELEVQFDIKADETEEAPFNVGKNLYIRIRNQRHRVSVPFDQRSKGFIWFFSFLVWFDSVSESGAEASDLILLLDEPGLSLHALAQADFLRYIDDLATKHQIIYTTHSPFMVHGDRLHHVRTVEDKPGTGTVISDQIGGSNAKTLFPLQAALGYSIAQNLFISKRNLLVEGPADLIYLKHASSILEAAERHGLRDDATVVPVGGLDKLSTFVALLGSNDLDLVVLHDYSTKPDRHLEQLVREKVLRERQVLHYGIVRAPKAKGATVPASDVEDLFTPSTYLTLFNAAFKKELAGQTVAEGDLPVSDRIVERLNGWIATQGVTLRPSGGFNHYRVANHFAQHPPKLDAATLARFEQLFTLINERFA
jgi:predicted ATPase